MPTVDELIQEEEAKKRKHHAVASKVSPYSFRTRNKNSTQLSFSKLFPLGIVALLILAAVFILSSKSNPDYSLPSQKGPSSTTPAQVVIIPFSYTVASIDASRIVLSGPKGNVTLPNDPTIVSVYKGEPNNRQPSTISSLKAGQKVKVETIPGQVTSLFIVQ